MVLTSEKNTFVMNGGCDFPMCQKKQKQKKHLQSKQSKHSDRGLFQSVALFLNPMIPISPHRSSWIPKKIPRSPARWTAVALSNLFEPESVLFSQVTFSPCFKMFQHSLAVRGRVTEICRIKLWDLESSTLLPIYYICIYNDSWCSHKLGRFSNNLERLHKSGS